MDCRPKRVAAPSTPREDTESATPIATPPDSALLDTRVIARLVEDLGRDSLMELSGLFLTESERRRRSIEAAVLSGNPAAACHEAHALKGSALTFGAAKLGALALEMEQAGRQGDLDRLTRHLPALERLTAETQAALSSLFPEESRHRDA
ncbi:Hpt domain-containing protein [Thiocapsa roseopersicina]|uniref:HPt (Histidine-containing phosphotransfer) domain-containing protein n=1 Tax=Thiocapsa roseopersicina TaxID=1058 RepID=A0A1H2TPP0_THIRO|nr:Hpt domain-containing protein [Thiocapsa roseopersicina]SDW45752.1 HPt (histidine-containing phosphotransfer) domain-containing protein [Thiocapsa roseopersicina]